MARTGVWTPSANEVERERTRELVRIGNNLNQNRALGQPPQVGGRRRRGEPPARRDRAGAADPGPAGGLMHLKFPARGRGAARAAAAYLLGQRNAAGKERASVEVLRGDPDPAKFNADFPTPTGRNRRRTGHATDASRTGRVHAP